MKLGMYETSQLKASDVILITAVSTVYHGPLYSSKCHTSIKQPPPVLMLIPFEIKLPNYGI